MTPSASPTAVIVAGGPGAGVPVAVRRCADESPGCAVVLTGVLSGFHPGAWDSAHAASAEVAADVSAWLMASAHRLAAGGAQVVVGVDTDDLPDPTPELSRVFADAGHRVRTVTSTLPTPLREVARLARDESAAGRWHAVGWVSGAGGETR
jgi:hypothetical protein